MFNSITHNVIWILADINYSCSGMDHTHFIFRFWNMVTDAAHRFFCGEENLFGEVGLHHTILQCKLVTWNWRRMFFLEVSFIFIYVYIHTHRDSLSVVIISVLFIIGTHCLSLSGATEWGLNLVCLYGALTEHKYEQTHTYAHKHTECKWTSCTIERWPLAYKVWTTIICW